MGGWNPTEFFFLTKSPNVEITTVGGCYGDVDMYAKGSLFWFGNQHIIGVPTPDRWGRGYMDQMFVKFCITLYHFLLYQSDKIVFKSLTARKEGDKYIARVQYDDVDLEMEVVEMFDYFTKELKERR